jgi:NodT family efflux transporter outer membrane factor (OMF) lipoprotein
MRALPSLMTVVAFGVALAGCAVGPRYVPPATSAVEAAPFVSAKTPVTADQTPPAAWWRLYNDPVLDSLVQRALAENQDLKVAIANLENARALVGEARSQLYPTTALSAGPSYGRTTTANADAVAAHQKEAKSTWTYSEAFTAAYEVDLFGRVRRSIQAARADAGAAEAARDAMRITVVAETAQAYVDICAYAEQAATARRSVDVVRQTYDITVRERDAGAASDFDVARAATLLRQAEAAVPPLDGARRVAVFELAALLGLPPAQAPAEATACKTPPKLTQPLPTGDGAALLRRRPDVRQAERQLAADTARIGVAVAGLYPDITLNASVDAAAASVSRLGNPTSVAYGLGPLISWTFPNTTLAQAQVRAARATAKGSLARFNSTVLQALKETEQALTTYGAELDHHAALAAAADRADEALRLADVQYKAGSLSFLDYLQTETIAVSADQALAASGQQLAVDQVAVFKALGGGWET